MRPIHLVRLDKTRPAVVLTRERIRDHLNQITVAPITSTMHGLSTEIRVGVRNGLDHDGVVKCDNIQTVPRGEIGRHVGFLLPGQEHELTAAILAAFDLE